MQHTRLSDYNPGRDIYIKIKYNTVDLQSEKCKLGDGWETQ